MRHLIVIGCIWPALALAQIGGQLGYQSLNLTTNPRTAALGGTTISLADGDISQFFENPATLDSVSSRNVFAHISPYFADVFIHTGAFSFEVGQLGTFAAGLHYVNFGSFQMTDESGNLLGDFLVQDYTIALGKAHQLGPVTLGANVKLAHSSIESFGSTALLMDVGGIFRFNKNWTVAMVFENIGFRLSEFTDFDNPQPPFDVKLGTTFKPEYMPLRFTFTTTNLVNDNFQEAEDTGGRSNTAIDEVWKRINLGAEILLNEHFQLLVGYNQKRRQELRLENQAGGVGFSYGMMLKIKRIEFRFSRATFHAAGGSNFISLRTDLNEFNKIL